MWVKSLSFFVFDLCIATAFENPKRAKARWGGICGIHPVGYRPCIRYHEGSPKPRCQRQCGWRRIPTYGTALAATTSLAGEHGPVLLLLYRKSFQGSIHNSDDRLGTLPQQ